MFTEKTREFIKSEISTSNGLLYEYYLKPEILDTKITYLERAIQIAKNLDRLSNLEDSIINHLNESVEDKDRMKLEVFKKVAQYIEIFIYLKNPDYYNTIQGLKKPDTDTTTEEFKEIFEIDGEYDFEESEELNEAIRVKKKELKGQLNEQRKLNSLSIPKGLKYIGIITDEEYDKIVHNFKKDDGYTELNTREKMIAKIYYIRNEISHADISLSFSQIWSYVRDILVLYIEIAYSFANEIDNELDKYALENDTTSEEYIENFITQYEDETISKYVTMRGINQKEKEEPTSLINLIKDKDRCRVKIIGNAGMGKTSTLRYLAYQDCKDRKDGTTNRLPIYIELKDISSTNNSIIKLICNAEHLSCSEETAINLLKRGYVNLYLDGINEIDGDPKLKDNVVSEINSIITTYPRIKVIITDRETNKNSITNNADVYLLEGFTNGKIIKYIQTNTIDEDERQRIMDIVLKGPNSNILLEMVRTPFNLFKLLEVIKNNGTIPETVEELDTFFRNAIIRREIEEKTTPGTRNYGNFISEILKINKEVYTRDELLDEISRVIKERNLSNQYSDQVIDILVQLGILQEIEFNEKYRFKTVELRYIAEEKRQEALDKKDQKEEKTNVIDFSEM